MKILYQDENILAVEKVSGLITHRNEWSAQGEPAALQIARDLISTKVYPVHRLDRSTSGVLLFTKSSESARSVKELFDSGHVQKTYIALVRGWLKETVKVDRQVDGKDALSLFEPIAHLRLQVPVGKYEESRYTLVRMTPYSGRTHQLRKHAVHLRHPIIGDRVHGDRHHNRVFKEIHKIDRLWLFATQIQIDNYLNEPLTIKCPISEPCLSFIQSEEFVILDFMPNLCDKV